MPKPSLHVVRGCWECPLRDREIGLCQHPEAIPQLRADYEPDERPPPSCPLRTGELRVVLTMSDDLRVGEREAMSEHNGPRCPRCRRPFDVEQGDSAQIKSSVKDDWDDVTVRHRDGSICYHQGPRIADELREHDVKLHQPEHDRLTRVERALRVLVNAVDLGPKHPPLPSNERAVLREFMDGLDGRPVE